MKPYAISFSDGHSEDWMYFDTQAEAVAKFNDSKFDEDDIHLHKLIDEEEGYEVIDSFWIEDYETLPRKETIDAIVGNDIESIRQMIYQDDISWVDAILRFGIAGYSELTDKQLVDQYRSTFGVDDFIIREP